MSLTDNQQQQETDFELYIGNYLESDDLTRSDNIARLLNQIDLLARSKKGMRSLYEQAVRLERGGIFSGTAWNDPSSLVPSLVKGTLQFGHPNSSLEIVSELRILAYANGRETSEHISAKEASNFITNVLVLNLEFALREPSEESRLLMSEVEVKKAQFLFEFILANVNSHDIKKMLAKEIQLVCSQRPVITRKVREMVALLNRDNDLYSDDEADTILKMHINAIHHPTELTRKTKSRVAYRDNLANLSDAELLRECEVMGQAMKSTGLVSAFHAILLGFIIEHSPDQVPHLLALSDTGTAEWHRCHNMLVPIIGEVIGQYNFRCIYGLSCMINRSLFSSRAVRMGIENLRKIVIHPKVERRILQSIGEENPHISARQYLLGATFGVLGQPLGIGQGNNPTCQSARGISMWATNTPARLIDLIINAASQDKLVFRFENEELDSTLLSKGLAQKIDYNLDAVSVVLVPHLDKIYNEMMKRASGRWQDPHKWVNPAMYGDWIQIGFASAYDYFTNSILDYRGFTRLFYSNFNLHYNGKRKMLYPNPVGIFLTSAKGQKIGFHAVSLLRVAQDQKQIMRVYFLNPNNEGRQDWGQGITPNVHGNGEHPGESSLPFHEFAARIYAFHFNDLELNHQAEVEVPDEEIDRVEKLAKESWGQAYLWNPTPKQWVVPKPN